MKQKDELRIMVEQEIFNNTPKPTNKNCEYIKAVLTRAVEILNELGVSPMQMHFVNIEVKKAINNIEEITRQRDELLKGAKILKTLMIDFDGDFLMQSKDLVADIMAGDMIEIFKKAIADCEKK